ncbi:MAG: PAS domain-containing sensor histidine kinase [Chloroflexi bacterium]|nr:PAS domain-containing sensor histidine kinase [Chloroflexota bacterium]
MPFASAKTAKRFGDLPTLRQHPPDSVRLLRSIARVHQDILYICEISEQGTFYGSYELAAYLGYSPLDIHNMGENGVLTVVHPDDQAKLTVRLAGFDSDEIVETQYRMRHSGGDWRWFYSRETVVERYADGSPRQILGVARDITRLRRAVELVPENKKLASALQQERELTRLKNDFMTTVSHELRTPLTVIMSSSEMLDRYFDQLSPVRRKQCLDLIRAQIQDMRDLLDTMALFTRYQQCEPQSVDLQHLCQNLVEEYLSPSRNHGVRIQLTAEGDLSCLLLDPNLVYHILANLLSNAIKYSLPEGEVLFLVWRSGADVFFQISDQGIGIPEDDLNHIFDTFYRADNVGTSVGKGLGLKIVRDYVALHGGDVVVESIEGQGSTFTVRLPAGG